MTKDLIVALIVLSAIEHDGVRYEAGDKLEVTERQALPLLEVKAAKLDEFEAAPEGAGSEGSETVPDGSAKPAAKTAAKKR